MSSVKILLVNLAAKRWGMQHVKLFRVPPLGLETLAGLTPPEHDVRIVDENAGEPVMGHDADLVGITAMTALAPRAYEVGDAYRVRGIPVVMGGHHVSLLPEEALQHADAVCIGEGDGVWEDMVADAARGQLQRVYRGNRGRFTEAPALPRRGLVNPRAYVTTNTIETTRGCPNDCDFCSVTHFYGKRHRRKPLDAVMAEIASLPDRRPVWFSDDNFGGHEGYTRELVERLKDVGRTWFCVCSIRVARKPDLLAEMRKAGCAMIYIGFEAIDKESMSSIHKGWMDPARYPEAIRTIHSHGIAVEGSFMFGLDTHTPDVFDRTADFCLDNSIDVVQFSISTPFPNTRLYQQLHAQGRIFNYDWSRYDCLHCVFMPNRMSPDQLQAGLHYAYHKFYSAGSIAKRLFRLPPHPLQFLIANYGFASGKLNVNDETGEAITRYDPADHATSRRLCPIDEEWATPPEAASAPMAEPVDAFHTEMPVGS